MTKISAATLQRLESLGDELQAAIWHKYGEHVAQCRLLGMLPTHAEDWLTDFLQVPVENIPGMLAEEQREEYIPYQRYRQYDTPKDTLMR